MVGELRCLNCSRHLADVVDGDGGRRRLSPPNGLATLPILVIKNTNGALACARCGGRPLLEQTLPGESAPNRQSARPRTVSAA